MYSILHRFAKFKQKFSWLIPLYTQLNVTLACHHLSQFLRLELSLHQVASNAERA